MSDLSNPENAFRGSFCRKTHDLAGKELEDRLNEKP